MIQINTVFGASSTIVRNVGTDHTPAYELAQDARDIDGGSWPKGTTVQPVSVGADARVTATNIDPKFAKRWSSVGVQVVRIGARDVKFAVLAVRS